VRFPSELVHAREPVASLASGNFVGDDVNLGIVQKQAWGGALVFWVVACGDGSGDTHPFGTGDGADGSGEDAASMTSPSSASADSTGASSASVGDDDDDGPDDGSDDGINLDVGSPTGGFGSCGCELDYLWVADHKLGTVSKINTITLVEEGRYLTRADGNGDPSRTSVNLSGDVAVANRHGGLVKFYADESDCVESNGMPGIQTSSGANNVLGWDVEECRAWYVEFPTTNQRPVAWTPGTIVPGTCDSEGEQVWTVTSAVPGFAPGTGGMGGVIATLVNGDDGSIVQEVAVDDFSGFQLGAYGGAVDAQGNLWFVPMGAVAFGSQLARVAIDDFTVTLWPVPAGVATYGITVDHEGDVWVSSTIGASAARFNVDEETWDVVMAGFMSLGGLAEGPDDKMWIAADGGARSIDIVTLEAGPAFIGGGTIKGISIDVDDYVWAVSDIAYKIEAATGQVVGTYNGLTSPYTYSDMTGHALANAFCPPEG